MPSNRDLGDDGFPQSSRQDEIANGISHGVGLALSIAGAITLIISTSLMGDGWRIAGCSVYAATLVAMYAASTLSHVFETPSRRRFFRMLDQGMIFLLIAGTYTPVTVATIDDGSWLLVALVWGVALAGFFCKILSGQQRIGFWIMLTYLLLGWIPGLALIPILNRIPSKGVWWLVAGGLSYTLGTAFLALQNKIPYSHMIWHLFVLAGSGCHYVAILCYMGSPIF